MAKIQSTKHFLAQRVLLAVFGGTNPFESLEISSEE